MVKVMEEAEEEVVAEVANMQMMQLRVRVIECADLVNKDLMGGNDVSKNDEICIIKRGIVH